MDISGNGQLDKNLTPAQQAMVELWEQHLRDEFELRDTGQTMDTMIEEPYNLNVPLMTGGVGGDGVREYYSTWFIPKNPPDMEVKLVSRTVGTQQIVDELVQTFTHTTQMDWMLPGIAPTGKRVEMPVVVIVGFSKGKIAYEHIYWDQAGVLAQLGLLDTETLPVVGRDSARKLLNPNLPTNALLERFANK